MERQQLRILTITAHPHDWTWFAGTLGIHVEMGDQATVCVVMASEGYPGSYQKGHPIEGLEEAGGMPGVVVFHSGTQRDAGGAVPRVRE